jgi:DDE family transposase
VGKTKRGKGMKLTAVADGSGLPVSMHPASASPLEITLVGEPSLASFAPGEPERLVGDRAYDSDPLDVAQAERSIEMITPHRKNRKKKTQDGRKLSGATRDAGRSSGCSPGFRTPTSSGLLRATGEKLPRIRAVGLHEHPAQASLR